MEAPDAFSMRIVSLDHYMAPPVPGLDVCFSSLEGVAVDLVPVVRVFGATPCVQRVCLHLHQVRRAPGCCAAAAAAAARALALAPPSRALRQQAAAASLVCAGVSLLLRALR